MWVFIANITDEPILGLDIPRAYDACVDIGRKKLCLAEKEVSLWIPVAVPHTSILVVAKDHVIPTQCERKMVARMESPLGIEKGLGEPNLKAHPPEGIYIARNVVQGRQELLVRILNTTHREKISRENPIWRTAS
jgi:hypothetical protein